MKVVRMKGRTVEEAVSAALAVLKVVRDRVEVRIISEGRPGVLGVIGGEEAEVEVLLKEGVGEEARQALQNILDKMSFVAVVDLVSEGDGRVALEVRGEDMGRIIGKEGNMLRALETIVAAILFKLFGQSFNVSIDAGGYRKKRVRALERLADEVAEEVSRTGEEKVLPRMSASDRRIIHLHLADHPKVITFSRGVGEDRRLVVSPRK
jgi:spoIIIJ-associated protein